MGGEDDWRNVRMSMMKSANTERIMMSLCLRERLFMFILLAYIFFKHPSILLLA